MWSSVRAVASVPKEALETIEKSVFEQCVINEKEEENDWQTWSKEELSDETKSKFYWLQHAATVVTPLFDLLAFVCGTKLCVISLGHSADNCVEDYELDEPVTSICFIPIASSQRSEPRPYDWSCIVVGFESGNVEFYSCPKLKLIYKQKFSTRPVRRIRFYHTHPDIQEIGILHDDCLACIDGVSLFTTLKACRSCLAFQAAGSIDAKTVEQLVEANELLFKKYRFSPLEATDVRDFVCVGQISRSSIYNQLETASMHGGYHASLRLTLPVYTAYVAVGADPFVCVFWADDSASSSLKIGDVVHNLAEKYVPSSVRTLARWTFGSASGASSAAASKVSPETARPTDMLYRSGLRELWSFDEASISPGDGRFVAIVSTSTARIALFDTRLRMIVRVWKGYRESQCGWLELQGDVSDAAVPTSSGVHASGGKSRRLRVLLLVIYIPKRGLLEIWTMQQGQRIAALNVCKNGRLISVSSAVLGRLGDAHLEGGASFVAHCCFLDAASASLQTFYVPLHAALQDESSSYLFDLNVFKELKGLLAASAGVVDEGDAAMKMRELVGSFKTTEVLGQAIDRCVASSLVLSSKLLSSLIDVAIVRTKTLTRKTLKTESASISTQRALVKFHALQQLLNVFAFVHRVEGEAETDVTSEKTAEVLYIELGQLELYIGDIDANSRLRKVKTAKRVELSFAKVVTMFDLSHCARAAKASETEQSQIEVLDLLTLRLSSELSTPDAAELGALLFKPLLACVTIDEVPSTLRSIVCGVGLSRSALVRLLAAAWLYRVHDYSVHPMQLYTVMAVLTESTPTSVLLGCFSDDERFADLLKVVEDEVLECTNLAEALTLALVVKGVAQNHAAVDRRGSETTAVDWEQISPFIERWDIIIRNLHHLVLLESLIRQQPALQRQEDSGCTQEVAVKSLSLKLCLEFGKSYVLEVLAVWLSEALVNSPTLLSVLREAELVTLSTTSAVAEFGDDRSWKYWLRRLLKLYPVTLETDALLANAAWHYASRWHREPTHVAPLLESSIAFLGDVGNDVLQHGVGLLIWQHFIDARFAAMCSLVEKVRKAPKDRQTRKELAGVTEVSLVRFATCCEKLLRLMLDANADYEACVPTHVQAVHEDFVDALFADFGGGRTGAAESPNAPQQQSLTERAARLKCTNFHLVEHHWQLAVVVRLMLEENLRPMQPLSTLFDAKGRNAFFKPFYAHPLLPMADVESAVRVAREQFLQRYVGALVEQRSAGATCEQPPNIRAALDLAKEFAIEPDSLYRHVIRCLYATGADAVAAKLLSSVENRTLLASELLLLVGERLSVQIDGRVTDVAAVVSPQLSTWLRSVAEMASDGQKGHMTTVSLDATERLLNYVAVTLSASHAETSIIEQLTALIARLKLIGDDAGAGK